MKSYTPSYIALYQNNELNNRIDRLYNILESCKLCPRECRVNRLAGDVGYCSAGNDVIVASYFSHFGEEAPLVGSKGSGTIFFSYCNLLCNFCQNYDISHERVGNIVDLDTLSSLMLHLQQQGCHNINLVTPTHFIPYIVAALPKAIENGLYLPIVYNCGGYESLQVIKLLDNIIDIYMPDAKFADTKLSGKYLNASDYFEQLKNVLLEMYNQVGNLKIEDNGIAYRGVLIRHLVMPNYVSDSQVILDFIARKISTDAYVNIMGQYHPCYKAYDDELINRRITNSEYYQVINIAKGLGLHRGF